MGIRTHIDIFIDSTYKNIEEPVQVNWEHLGRDIRQIFNELYQMEDFNDGIVDISFVKYEEPLVMKVSYRRDGQPYYDFMEELSTAYPNLDFIIEWYFEDTSQGYIWMKNGKVVKEIELPYYGQ